MCEKKIGAIQNHFTMHQRGHVCCVPVLTCSDGHQTEKNPLLLWHLPKIATGLNVSCPKK